MVGGSGGQRPSPQDSGRAEAQGPAAAQSCQRRGPPRVTATGRDPGRWKGWPRTQGAGVRGPQERTCSLGVNATQVTAAGLRTHGSQEPSHQVSGCPPSCLLAPWSALPPLGTEPEQCQERLCPGSTPTVQATNLTLSRVGPAAQGTQEAL